MMVRHKDILSPTLLRQKFPHIVEIPLPPLGLQHRLVLMEQWLTDYSEAGDYAQWGTRRDPQDIAVWGFREEITAAAFRANAEMILKLTDRQVTSRLAKRRG